VTEGKLFFFLLNLLHVALLCSIEYLLRALESKSVKICGFDLQYQRLVVGRRNVYVLLFESPYCLNKSDSAVRIFIVGSLVLPVDLLVQ